MGKISVNLVVHNEERIIKRCLDSLKNYVDEIIVVHDGPCSDKTLDICKKYNAKIFVKDFVGEAEPHRPFALSKAIYEWVLALDADEYLTEELQKSLRKLVEGNFDGYSFIWPIYYKGKRITKGPLSKNYRLVLFRKDKTSISGVIHDWYKVKGVVKKTDLVLGHEPRGDLWTWKGFHKKDAKWARLQAERAVKEGKARYPSFFYIIKAFVWFFLVFIQSLFKGVFLNGVAGLRAMFFMCYYNFLINWYIFEVKVKRD